MTKTEKAREFFMADRFAMVTTGIDIVDVAPQYAKCRLDLNDGHRNAAGQVMGGAIFTLADFTFAVATNFEQDLTVTTVSQISYLSPAKGDALFGESRMIKDGKRTCFYDIEITDGSGTLVALVHTTGMHLAKPVKQ